VNFGPPEIISFSFHFIGLQTRMWANAQRDGRPAEYRQLVNIEVAIIADKLSPLLFEY